MLNACSVRLLHIGHLQLFTSSSMLKFPIPFCTQTYLLYAQHLGSLHFAHKFIPNVTDKYLGPEDNGFNLHLSKEQKQYSVTSSKTVAPQIPQERRVLQSYSFQKPSIKLTKVIGMLRMRETFSLIDAIMQYQLKKGNRRISPFPYLTKTKQGGIVLISAILYIYCCSALNISSILLKFFLYSIFQISQQSKLSRN